MNFGFYLILLTTSLYNSCLANVHPPDDAIQPSIAEHRQDIPIENRRNTSNLTNINMDVLSIIFDQLDLKDLITMIDVYPMYHIHSLAVRTFRGKYKNYKVYLRRNKSKSFLNRRQLLTVFTHKKCINIINFELFTDTLKYFGGEIEYLRIRNGLLEHNVSCIVSQVINEYESESLLSIDLGKIKEDTLEQFSTPFYALKTLSLIVGNGQYKNGSLAFNQLFPILNRLKLDVYDANGDYAFIQQ